MLPPGIASPEECSSASPEGSQCRACGGAAMITRSKDRLRPTDIPEEQIANFCKALGIDSDEATDLIMSLHNRVMRGECAPKDRLKLLKKLLVEEFDRRGIGYRH
jgi:hypothetical protein